jgi:murein DD-endopeptidase MepM/ murein hydrolase activator NlpD
MVKKGVYRSSALSVPRAFTEPDAATLERIELERNLKREKFATVGKLKQWSGRFVAPMVSVITEPFGTERTFNGERQSVHHGVDYRAAIGTPVLAMNRGTVLLARELFFEGNCIVLDHGQGVLTLYLHLSEMTVKEGDLVDKSQSIGLSGGTGRVTAPHLHAPSS